jgi:hypothetical protein
MVMAGRRFDPAMMVALLLYGYCQGERSSRQIERRCVRDVGYRVIVGGLHPDHATIARFRARHERALGGLFSQVLRLLAAEGMVSLGMLSLDGTKLAGNAAQAANHTLPQIEKILAEAAETDAAEDAGYGDAAEAPMPRPLARRAERRERLARARDRLAAEDQARRDAQRAKVDAWEAAAAAGKPRGRRPGGGAADQPQQHQAAGQHHRPGRASDAQPERLRRGLQRPTDRHLPAGDSRCHAQPATRRPHPSPSAARHLPAAADRGRDPTTAAHWLRQPEVAPRWRREVAPAEM